MIRVRPAHINISEDKKNLLDSPAAFCAGVELRGSREWSQNIAGGFEPKLRCAGGADVLA
jgi:hypothetical protein